MKSQPTVYSLVVPQGTTYTLALRYLDSAGAPIDLTGYIVRGALKKAHKDAVAALTFSTANGNVISPDAQGNFGVVFRPADTSPLKATDHDLTDDAGRVIGKFADHFYDIELEAPSGDVSRAMYGVVTLTAEVSK